MKEEWRKTKGFDYYSVSTEGRVRNDFRRRMVKTSITRDGTAKVNLYQDGYCYTRSVKNLVATAWLPRRGDPFDTVMCLDLDQSNARLSNLVWRPRWFAWKYSNQIKEIELYITSGQVVERKTGIVYDNIVHASLANGLLFYEVGLALTNNLPVFPDWRMFDWYQKEET